MELSLLPIMLLLISNIQPGHTQGKPKATVITEYEKNESLTVRCEISGPEDDWTHSWFVEGSSHPFTSDREFSIKSGESDSSSNITCIGERKSDGKKSEISDAVTLAISRQEASEEHRSTLLNDKGNKLKDKPKVIVKPQSSVFTGDTVTLSCDVGHSTRQTIFWYKNNEKIKSDNETKTLRNVNVSDGGKYACSVPGETIQSQVVLLTVRERPKPVVRVHPDGRVLRGQTVTLTCDIQETDVTSWNYSWKKDDSVIHVSQSQEYRISSVHESHTGHYSCTGRETQGSRYSHTSDEVTLAVSAGSSESDFSEAQFHALLIGVIAGLSIAFLLTFLLVLLFCCKRNKGGGSLSPSTDHQLQNISQTSEHPKKSRQTPLHSDIVIGHSDVTYVKIDLKSMKEMKKKQRENKGKESSNTVYSNLRL